MLELSEMQLLLSQIAGHIKAGTTAERRLAVEKLHQLSAISTTAAFTLRMLHKLK